ncbi:MAG: ankyrin repeat domain-containing protein [Pseudomonadales bacterium]|nr:ankyrin repeat domain-containing protein [Pseudomonadales bacterium]
MGQYSAYHLSDCETLCTESPSHSSDLFGDLACQSGILATRASYIAGFLKPTHRYLHRVSYDDSQIAHVHEEGHHDGASSFSTLEYVLLSDAEIVESWTLSERDDLMRLAASEFIQQLHGALIGSPNDFIAVLVQGLQASLDRDCLAAFRLKPQGIVDVMDKVPVALLRSYVKSGLLAEQELCALYDNELFRAGSDYQEKQRGRDPQSTLLSLFDESFAPQPPSVQQAVARYHFIAGAEWKPFLAPGVMLGFTERQFRYLREAQGEQAAIAALLDDRLAVAIESEPYLLRALVTGRTQDAVSLLKRYANHRRGLLTFIRHFVALYGHPPRFRFDVLPFYEEVKREQFSAGSLTLRQLCESGYAAALEQHLKTENPPLKALNSALPYAADMGYTHMVKLLHEAGADLDTWANYAIKTATSKGYGPLLRYLRDNGVSWEEPEKSDSAWGF